MATNTRTRARKTAAAKAKPEATVEEATVEETPAEQPAKAAPAVAYRKAEGFEEAMKSLRSLAKGTPLKPLAQLITHLAWKTPGGTVGWTKETTPDVPATADDLAIGVGTAIPEALETVLSAAEKEVNDSQREAFQAVAGIIRGHAA